MTDGHGLALEIRNLVQVYNDRDTVGRAVLDISHFELPAAAHVAIGGPSGVGKSTLLHVLSGIDRPTSGLVSWGGVDITRMNEAARDSWRRQNIGMVFQDFHLIDGLSLLENVTIIARFSTFTIPPEMRMRARCILDRLGLNPDGRNIETLSRGERQRLAVARAILTNPPIILADEPTASLDATAGSEIGQLLIDLARESGATLIIVTHDPALAGRMDHVFDLQGGQLNLRREPGR